MMGAFDKKLEECKNTNIYCTSVKNYLLNLLGNFEIADVITPYITQLTSLLSEHTCWLLKPIKIGYNFIESDRFCFDIEGKKFIRNPKRLKGFLTAYVRYTYHEDKIPNSKPFIEGMNNIFKKMFDLFIISY